MFKKEGGNFYEEESLEFIIGGMCLSGKSVIAVAGDGRECGHNDSDDSCRGQDL